MPLRHAHRLKTVFLKYRVKAGGSKSKGSEEDVFQDDDGVDGAAAAGGQQERGRLLLGDYPGEPVRFR